VTVFGLFELMPTWPKNRVFSEHLFFIHSVTGIALALSGGREHRRVRMLTSLKGAQITTGDPAD
jgi:hypothetical protein